MFLHGGGCMDGCELLRLGTRYRSDRQRCQGNARVAKRPQHALEFNICHEPNLSVILEIQSAQPGQGHRFSPVQRLGDEAHKRFHGAQSLAVIHPMAAHQFVGQQPVIGRQPGVEKHIAGRGDDFRFGLVEARRPRIAHKPSQPRQHHTIMVPKHPRQHSPNIRGLQWGAQSQ